MTIRTDWLAAIKVANDAGLDGLAFALIVLHDRFFPEEQLKPLYDRMVLENLNRHRQLVDIDPTEDEGFDEFCARKDREQIEADEQRELEEARLTAYKAWRRS